MPEDPIHPTFVLHFTRIGAISGTMADARGSYKLYVCIAFYKHWGDLMDTVVWRFKRIGAISGTMIDARGSYKIYVCITFYAHWGDLRDRD